MFKYSIKILLVLIFSLPLSSQNDTNKNSNDIKRLNHIGTHPVHTDLAINNNDITIYGDGNQTRSFQYIEDLVGGLINVMSTTNDFIGPINIGNPNEISMNELASIVLKLTNSNSKIVHQNLPEDDPKKRRPEISLAKDLISWYPKIDLESGLLKTINYFRKINEVD